MEALLSIKDLTQKIRISESSIYDFIKTKGFPKPIKIGRQNRWKEDTVQQWVDMRVVA